MSDQPNFRALVPEAMTSRLSRRGFLIGAAGVGAAASLAACGAGSSSSSSGGGKLNLYTWGDYDDPKVLKAFASVKGGATVKVDSYSSNPELISKLSAAKGTSGYDVCVPTHSNIQQMASLGLLEKLDLSKIPNFKELDDNVVNTSFDPGNKYSVCKDWGSTGFVYDTTVIKRQLTSWADFVDAAQKEASGKTSLLEDQGEVARIFFFSHGIDPNTNKKSDVEAYRAWALKELAPHVQNFASSSNSAISTGSSALVQAWNGDARLGILGAKDPSRYQWVWPSEGANLWQDNWCIVKGAPHAAEAYDFINYILDPQVSLKELSFVGYNTGVKGIEDAAKKAGVERPDLIFIDPSRMSKLVYSEINDQTEAIIKVYDELKAAAGK